MNEQQKADIQYDLDMCRMNLGNVAANGALANQSIKELAEAIRHINAAIQQIVDKDLLR